MRLLVLALCLAGCAGQRDAPEPPPAPADAAPDATPELDADAADAAADLDAADAAAPDAAPFTCSTGRTICSTADAGLICVDTWIDVDHCGGCGVRCAAGQTCSSALCR